MAFDTRHRDQIGELNQKHGDLTIRTLRRAYGAKFAKDGAVDEKLSDVLAKLDQRSLSKLVRDYEAGMIPIRLAFAQYH